jgi:hypothetical protein
MAGFVTGYCQEAIDTASPAAKRCEQAIRNLAASEDV